MMRRAQLCLLSCLSLYLFLLLALPPAAAQAGDAGESPCTPRNAADICRANDKHWGIDIPRHDLVPPFENVRQAGWAANTLESDHWLNVSVSCRQSVNFSGLPFVMQWLQLQLDDQIADTGQKPLPELGHLQDSGLTAEQQKGITFVKTSIHARSCAPVPHTSRYLGMSCSSWNDDAMSGRWQLWGATFDLEQKKMLALKDIFADWDKAAPALTALLKAYYADEDPNVRDGIQTDFGGDWTSFFLEPEGLTLLVTGYPIHMWHYMKTTLPVEALRPFLKPGFWPL